MLLNWTKIVCWTKIPSFSLSCNKYTKIFFSTVCSKVPHLAHSPICGYKLDSKCHSVGREIECWQMSTFSNISTNIFLLHFPFPFLHSMVFRSKMFLICWCPDSARVKKKMLYSSTFDTLKRAFLGVHKVRCYQYRRKNKGRRCCSGLPRRT